MVQSFKIRGFQMQGSRSLLFSPEHAAEFYKDRTDDTDFMVLVILLSKGISEAFVLAKDNAVRDLGDIMCCYFGSSSEMERMIHVTMCPHKAQHIHDPIYCPEHLKCCNDESLMRPMISKLYDIIKEDDGKSFKVSWKTQLTDELMSNHETVGTITNISSYNPKGIAETTQTKETSLKWEDERHTLLETLSVSSGLSVSTSSCLSCSPFGDDEKYAKQFHRKTSLVDLIKAKTTPLKLPSSSRSTSSMKPIRRKVQRKERKVTDASHFSLDVVDEESLSDNVDADNYGDEHYSQFDAESETGAQSEFKRKLKSQPPTDLQGGTKAKAKSELDGKAQFEPMHKSASEAQSELRPEPRSEIRLEGKTELEEEIQSEPEHVLRPELESQPQLGFQPETELEAESELVEEVKSIPKHISRSELQSQSQIEFPPHSPPEGNTELAEDIQSESKHALEGAPIEYHLDEEITDEEFQ
ncbi:hypothetical protein GQX74_006676 [Glossina fuscipes]|nr:hypothetical protein GQX74_006676 [Glossina fuscipes]